MEKDNFLRVFVTSQSALHDKGKLYLQGKDLSEDRAKYVGCLLVTKNIVGATINNVYYLIVDVLHVRRWKIEPYEEIVFSVVSSREQKEVFAVFSADMQEYTIESVIDFI